MDPELIDELSGHNSSRGRLRVHTQRNSPSARYEHYKDQHKIREEKKDSIRLSDLHSADKTSPKRPSRGGGLNIAGEEISAGSETDLEWDPENDNDVEMDSPRSQETQETQTSQSKETKEEKERKESTESKERKEQNEREQKSTPIGDRSGVGSVPKQRGRERQDRREGRDKQQKRQKVDSKSRSRSRSFSPSEKTSSCSSQKTTKIEYRKTKNGGYEKKIQSRNKKTGKCNGHHDDDAKQLSEWERRRIRSNSSLFQLYRFLETVAGSDRRYYRKCGCVGQMPISYLWNMDPNNPAWRNKDKKIDVDDVKSFDYQFQNYLTGAGVAAIESSLSIVRNCGNPYFKDTSLLPLITLPEFTPQFRGLASLYLQKGYDPRNFQSTSTLVIQELQDWEEYYLTWFQVYQPDPVPLSDTNDDIL